jgi:hypothetical protein
MQLRDYRLPTEIIFNDSVLIVSLSRPPPPSAISYSVHYALVIAPTLYLGRIV